MSPPLLEVEDLAKSYGGVHAVRGVSFTLEAGRVLAMIGPNGAGKSTCFNMLNGQIRPDAGAVRIEGRDVAGLSPQAMFRLGVGRTFQITATFGSMTVRENIQVALLSAGRRLGRLTGFGSEALADESEALCRLVGMADATDRACGELAYGDLKRLELAIALAGRPRLLLMDEPTAGMGPAERVALMRLASGIVQERGIGILFTEHDMDVVFEHADRVLVLDRGRIIAAGPPAEVRADARVREVYLGQGHVFAAPRASPAEARP